MAKQPEKATFDEEVYQLETADPVLGGIGGLSNIPLLNLANRTRWLKQAVDAINEALQLKAPLNSPALTGTPTAPTQSLEDESTRVATTDFSRKIVSGKLEKALSGAAGVTLTAAEAGNGLLILTGAITAAVNVVVPGAARRWIVFNGTSGGFSVTVKTAGAAGVAVPPAMALELWCDGLVVRTVAANAWATPRKLKLNGPVTGEATLDGAGDTTMQTAVLAASDTQSGLVELATNAETIAGTDTARAVTPASLAALTATTERRGLVELATDDEVDAGTDTERAVTPAGVKRRIDTRAIATRKILAGNGLTGGGDLSGDRTVTLGTPSTLSGSTANVVTAESHTHAVASASTTVSGVVELATNAETIAGTDTARAVTPASLAALTATTERRGLVELLTSPEAIELADKERALTAAALGDVLGDMFAGMLAYFPFPSPPPGWLERNGAAISVTAYARLANRLYVGDALNGTARYGYRCSDPKNPSGTRSTTGGYIVLPDDRGEFERGWDHGRGIDPDRVLGSLQDSDNKSHSHEMVAGGKHSHSVYDPGHAHTTTAASYSRGSYQYAPGEVGHYPGWAPGTATGGAATGIGLYEAGAHTHAIALNGAGESRPRNVAYLPCIKY